MLTHSCRKAATFVERLSLILAGTLLIVNVGTILFSVASRYIFRSSYIWTDELARYTLIYFVMFAANAAWKTGEHMRIEIFEQRLPAKVRTLVDWAKRILIAFMFGFMTVEGYSHALRALSTKTVGLGIPRAVPLMAIPIGMGLLLLQFILSEIATYPRKES